MKILTLFLLLALLTGCAGADVAETSPQTLPETTEPVAETASQPATEPDPIREMLNDMSLEERVGQLFLARCDNTVALQDIENYHLGGFVLFAADFENETPASIQEKLKTYQAVAKIPLLIAVDEEGGTVTRVSRFPAFRHSPFPSPRDEFASGGYEAVMGTEEEKCILLKSLGINVNLGPVCDMATERSAFMYKRSLGQSPAVTARYVMDTVNLMENYQIGSCLKHFPGYGNNTDTHTGIAVDSRGLEELEQIDLYPFRSGIDAGCGAIMVSHTIVEAIDPEVPASMSPAVHQYLRQKMGFDGVIITDDLVMQAITDLYGAGEAAVLAVLAGNDLLCSTEYRTQYDAVLSAVMDGRIDIDTLNQATSHVLQWKIGLGLL